MDIPEKIITKIKRRAAAEWPADFEMQRHEISEQRKSYLKVQKYINNMGKSKMFQVIYQKTVNDWPEDYNMQLHTIQNQIDAAGKVDEFDYPREMGEEIRLTILGKALVEWKDDYEMQLHEITNQVDAWLDLQKM